MDVSIDRTALREIVSNLRTGPGENEWCVACGAGAASSKLDYPAEVVQQVGRQLLDPKGVRELVEGLKALGGEQAWCVACGAGASASPADLVSNPAKLSDSEIDALAGKLLGAVRLKD